MHNLKEIVSTFESIPSRELLEIASDVSKKGHHAARQKDDQGEYGWVTEADLLIEQAILKHFSASLLSGSYLVRSEEGGEASSQNPNWQLIIDPIDGTSPYRKGEKEWGVMIGAADLEGALFYSWNLTSDGSIYKTGDSLASRPPSRNELRIDVCDYGVGAAQKFPEVFTRKFPEIEKQIVISELPAAVWVGRELWGGALDGMLWIPSLKGKNTYPAHDLIFLGALIQAGFSARLGKIGEHDAMIAVSNEKVLTDRLWMCGEALMDPSFEGKILESESPLQIVPKVEI